MDFGLCLPNFPDGASAEGIEAAASIAEACGMVDRLDDVVSSRRMPASRRIYDDPDLAWVGSRHLNRRGRA
jgi:hypothetical protein